MKNFIVTIILTVFMGAISSAQAFDFKENWAYVPVMVDVNGQPDGFMYRSILLCGPKIDDEKYTVKDTIPLYDVYAVKGKKTKVIGIVDGIDMPRVVFEVGKDVVNIADMKPDERIQEFLELYGWDKDDNFVQAFLPRQRLFLNSIMKQTTPVVQKKSGATVECVAYDFFSQNAIFHSNNMFMSDVFSKDATQRFIDKQARKAHYNKSTNYLDLKRLFDEKDPETIEFVSKYLTWAGKWDKKLKARFQQQSSESHQ